MVYHIGRRIICKDLRADTDEGKNKIEEFSRSNCFNVSTEVEQSEIISEAAETEKDNFYCKTVVQTL